MTYLIFFLYIIFVSLLFITTSPLLLCVALWISVTSGFPIVFRQRRIGKDGTPFTLYKFRTMRKGAEKEQSTYIKSNEADGPVFKIHDDPRFTPIGKFLSHTGLDELPQLWNVIKGDMALFGPRPLPVAEAKKLSAWQKKRHSIKPGIISPWVFEGYHSRLFNDWMKSDIAYVNEKSFNTDCILLWKTIVFMGKLFIHEVEDRFVS